MLKVAVLQMLYSFEVTIIELSSNFAARACNQLIDQQQDGTEV
jgi:hypothetical protein